MMSTVNHHIGLTIKSFLFHRKEYLNNILIIALLAGIITGSLMTGDSVRESLKRSSEERLGNTYLVASTGLRLFDPALSQRLNIKHNIATVPVFETDGYCQNFSTGTTALNVSIYGVDSSFFDFHGKKGIRISPGEVLLNRNLAKYLGIKTGEEIIIRLREADPIPENAPFSPGKKSENSKVFVVSAIIDAENAGNFSLGISQMTPKNIFMNLEDTGFSNGNSKRCNRLLAGYNTVLSDSALYRLLKNELSLNDIGLKIRKSSVTRETEIISDRIFIDSSLVFSILSQVKGYPILTYLANSISVEGAETPYSFISGMDEGYSFPSGSSILINKWLAGDIHAISGDSLTLSWFYPVGNHLETRSEKFVVSGIAGSEPEFNDPSLMPEFPGISGRTSCSSWDAGIPILIDKIRDKDEEYWNLFKGTPKAFVSYETAKRLWGNNFGMATALRFPESTTPERILEALIGNIDPADAGFTVSDVRESGREAAVSGVDFGTLFLSLGFFMLLSCVILLTFTISIYFDSKKDQIRTFHALGFRNKLIGKITIYETLVISVTGALAGVILGYAVNFLLVKALNSVWTGAVQTNTIIPAVNLLTLIAGFLSTIFISQLIVIIKLRRYLQLLSGKSEKRYSIRSARKNFILFLLTLLPAIILLLLTLLNRNASITVSFSGGILIFISFILALRQYYLSPSEKKAKSIFRLSAEFYRFNPSQALAPMIFIASGLFAIIITGSNRQAVTAEMLENKGGTGGYLLFAESALPVRQDLNSDEGKKEFGLNEPQFGNPLIVQIPEVKGDDASCLNLNKVKAPPLLGIDPSQFMSRGSFSFATVLKNSDINPWLLLNERSKDNIIYGIADQTVLQWGLMKKTGDTLIYRTEKGKTLHIVICGGLKSSVFQGHLIIGEANLREYFPSVPGSSLFLFDTDSAAANDLITLLSDRFSNYGLSVEKASDKLASFFVVTNTYLNVFTILGILGLVLGVLGLGFILTRNFELRKSEFSLLYACGYNSGMLRKYLITDQVLILLWGVIAGTLSAIIATLPSLRNNNGISLSLLLLMTSAVIVVGLAVLFRSVNRIKSGNLVLHLRKE
jgi:ABC-type antimicrobial peptide transport system permease subunit